MNNLLAQVRWYLYLSDKLCFTKRANLLPPNVGDEAQTTAARRWQKRASVVRRCLSPRLTG